MANTPMSSTIGCMKPLKKALTVPDGISWGVLDTLKKARTVLEKSRIFS